MARKILFVVLIITCFIWTGFIFSNSLRNADESTEQSAGVTQTVNKVASAVGIDEEITHSQVRNMAHFTEFAVLSLLVAVTVSVGIYPRVKKRIALSLLLSAASVPICFALAGIDELLQGFSDGRASQFSDVMLDTLGALCGAVAFAIAYAVFILIRSKIYRKRELK